MIRRTASCLLLGLATALGCVGSIGDRDDGALGGGDDDGASAPGAEELAPSGSRLLTRSEYERSLRDLLGADALAAADLALLGMPGDRGKMAFSSMVQGLTANHVEAYFRVADAAAEYLVADPARLGSLEECLGTSSPDAACIQTFVERFGRRVLRRPVEPAEVTAFVGGYAEGAALSHADGVHVVLLQMLEAPAFLYRLELSGEPVGPVDTFELSGFELATRLSFLAWGTTPDAELLDAAQSGALDTTAGVDAAVSRLFSDPRATENFVTFVTEWLDLDRIPNPQQSAAFLDGIAPETLAAEMRAELEAVLAHHAFATQGTLSDLLTSSLSFVASAPLADVYGVAPGGGDPVDLPAEQRAGLLTRAGILSGAGESTHPVKRGVFVRRKFLCDAIPPPDPKDFPPNTIVPPEFDADKTARERWTDKTSAPACAACHSRINPIGFALEAYDTLGRYRQIEPIVDPSSGQVVNELPIDDRVTVELIPGEPIEVAGAVGLGQALAESPLVASCFARQWLHFVSGRADLPEDEPLIDALEAAQAEGGLLRMLAEIAKRPSFRLRKVQP